ncbi:OmpH family outer membrane protein [Robiginitalea aurantiaca]|uniref:OmpH family outer membrane protein n=1 Tax=Robiginitalea aurantiaca TaxID=3056915 RepID=A0ABT7WCX6_9FLAO|nr:OmpH family outer membrane protein [Robiginitalea aurantiaca]MDM9630771.1 OmpH family outer membrane protein [Robiginitalea aurantiaca]
MKQFIQIVFRAVLLPVILFTGFHLASQETRTYREEFKVGPDVVVEVNTSYADIEFETWSKNEVEVEATITLEGATAEEANAYFDRPVVEILGNSSKVSVRSGGRGNSNSWVYAPSGMEYGDMDFDFEMPELPEMPEMPEIAPMVADIIASIPELVDMPPMPPMPNANFDYEAYKKDGEKYMKKWQKQFEKEFDEEYQEEFEAWGKEMESRAMEMSTRIEAREAAREAMREQRDLQRAEMQEQREAMREQQEAAREQMMEAREQARAAQMEARDAHRNAKVFYVRGASGNQKFSIKKTIKIKMPKGARLDMNVRYGEVKLADNALNTRANLSYSSLLANNINGTDTNIEVRYSPVTVERWNGGRLQTEYSDGVRLSEVSQLNMVARSSMVTIDQLLREVSIDSKMGSLIIGGVAEDFKEMDVSVQYGEFRCKLPRSSYNIEVRGAKSEILYPDFVHWDKSQGTGPILRKGYSQQKDSGRSILINAAYSDVTLN